MMSHLIHIESYLHRNYSSLSDLTVCSLCSLRLNHLTMQPELISYLPHSLFIFFEYHEK